jgi:hypothetical protein
MRVVAGNSQIFRYRSKLMVREKKEQRLSQRNGVVALVLNLTFKMGLFQVREEGEVERKIVGDDREILNEIENAFGNLIGPRFAFDHFICNSGLPNHIDRDELFRIDKRLERVGRLPIHELHRGELGNLIDGRIETGSLEIEGDKGVKV